MAKAKGSVDITALHRAANGSARLNEVVHSKAEDMKRHAMTVFMSRQITTNEWRVSATTPPKYLGSFVVTRILGPNGSFSWEVRNTDPGAQFVEWGAHAGGRTPVLGYRPMTTALVAAGFTR